MTLRTDVLMRVCDVLVRVCDVLVRVCDVLVPGFEPEARERDRWRALPQVFRPRASGSEPVGSVLLARSVTK